MEKELILMHKAKRKMANGLMEKELNGLMKTEKNNYE